VSDAHARCPTDGCLDVEPLMAAHTGPKAKDAPRTFYNADRRLGGCGTTWAEASAAAAHNDRQRGINPKHLKEEARIGRAYFLPSDGYRENYDRIFRKEADDAQD
jgi:hypothetical protein